MYVGGTVKRRKEEKLIWPEMYGKPSFLHLEKEQKFSTAWSECYSEGVE